MLSFESLFKNQVKEYTLKQLADYLKTIKDFPKTNYKQKFKYFAIKNENKLAGLIVVDENPEGGFYGMTKEQMGHDIEIVFFYVFPEFRGMKIGQELLRYVIQKYSTKYIGLGTSKQSFENAKQMYKRNGFNIISDFPKEGNSWWLRKPEKK